MDRFTDEQTGRAIDQAIAAQIGPFEKTGPVIDVFMLGANPGPFAVEHKLGMIPDGVINVYGNGYWRAWNLHKWTDTVAYLRNDVVDTHARMFFVKVRKGIIDGNG